MPRHCAISPITVGVSLHEQLRRATSIEELAGFARRVPPMLGDRLSRGLAAGRVIAVYSGFLDTIIRRAIGLVFAGHPELSVDAFTWLSLGSNGRQEAVLSSDVDSAVAFDNSVDADTVVTYRAAFAEVSGVLATAGLSADDHGATAQQALFARTNADCARRREVVGRAGRAQRRDDDLPDGGRPAHPRRPRAAAVIRWSAICASTRRDAALLQESLSYRAKLRSRRGSRPAAPTPSTSSHTRCCRW